MAAGWRNEFRLNDTWSLVADLSYSKAKRDQSSPRSKRIRAPRTAPRIYDTGTFLLRGNNNMPSLSFGWTTPTRPRCWSVRRSTDPATPRRRSRGRADLVPRSMQRATADMGWFVGAAFGVNYSDRPRIRPRPSRASAHRGRRHQVDDEFLLSPTDLGYADAGQALASTSMACWPSTSTRSSTVTRRDGFPYLAGKYWNVKEEVFTGFVRGDLSHDISATPYAEGNVGLQVIDTDQSRLFPHRHNAGQARRIRRQVVHRRPAAAQFRVHPAGNEQAFRVGVAKELARARMDQLKATEEAVTTSVLASRRQRWQPAARSLGAWAFDVSYEKYSPRTRATSRPPGVLQGPGIITFSTQTDTDHDFSELLNATPTSYFQPGVHPTPGKLLAPRQRQGGYL